jgi:hypothetical protein
MIRPGIGLSYGDTLKCRFTNLLREGMPEKEGPARVLASLPEGFIGGNRGFTKKEFIEDRDRAIQI